MTIDVMDILDSTKFPVIDFVFKNQGDSFAVMTGFAIELKRYVINKEPRIQHFLEIPKKYKTFLQRGSSLGPLSISLKNIGWGSAYNLKATLSTPLDIIFPKKYISSKYTIHSGERRGNVFFLGVDDIDPMAFNAEIKLPSLYSATEKNTSIMLPLISAEITYEDENNRIYNKSLDLFKSNTKSNISISRDGFLWCNSVPVKYCIMRGEQDAIYYTIIKESLVGSEKFYPILHKCLPNNLEYMSLMIASDKSCEIEIRLRFELNNNKIIHSEWIIINIENTIDGRDYMRYADGDELISRRHLDENVKIPLVIKSINKNILNSRCA